jgi:hypothetical protein
MAEDNLPKAWIVEVETSRLGSGLPAHEYFAVAVDSAQEAQEVVRKIISATDELVVTRAELRPAAVQALGLTAGQIERMTGPSGPA